MYKYRVSIVLITLSFCTFINQTTTQQCRVPLNSKTALIICDIDDVIILGRQEGYMAWLMAPHHWSFALTVKKVKKRFKLSDPVEICEKIRQLYPKLSNQAYAFEKAISSGLPKKKTIAIMKELVDQGYQVMAASNMSKGTYRFLIKNNVLPVEIFPEKIFFVKTKKCNKKADGSYFEKPNNEYFIHLQHYVAKKYPDQIFQYLIFIDDKKENVKAARKAGLIAIRYKNSKQLKRCLTTIGVEFSS